MYLNRRRRSQALWTLDRFDSNPPIAQFKIEVFMIRSLLGTQGQLMFQGFKCRLYLRILSINSEWHLSITSHKSFVNASLLYLLVWWVLTLIWWITRYLNLCSRQQYFSSSEADVNSTTKGLVWRNFCSRVVFKILNRLNTIFAKSCFFSLV